MWDMCRFEQSKYSTYETSPICSIFTESDVQILEKMEYHNLNSGTLENPSLIKDFTKLMNDSFAKEFPKSVTVFFTGPTAFRLFLNDIGIETNGHMSIAANLAIVKYK